MTRAQTQTTSTGRTPRKLAPSGNGSAPATCCPMPLRSVSMVISDMGLSAFVDALDDMGHRHVEIGCLELLLDGADELAGGDLRVGEVGARQHHGEIPPRLAI